MKKLFRVIAPITVAAAQMCYAQQSAIRPSSQAPAPIRPSSSVPQTGFVPGTNGTALGQPSTALGQPAPALGQPAPVLGQPSTVLGPPNTALGPPNNALGQPNTAIVPSGTTTGIVPSGSTTALTPSGTTNSFTPGGTVLGIGQQPQNGLASTPVTNGFIVNPDGSVIAVPQGAAPGNDLGATNTGAGGFFRTNRFPNP